MANTRFLRLERLGVQSLNIHYYKSDRLRITAGDAVGISAAVFLYRREAATLYQDAQDTFQGVCSPLDLETWGVGDPDPGESYFRLATVEVDLPTAQQTLELWGLIAAEVCELREALGRQDELAGGLTHVSGDSAGSLTLTLSALTTVVVGGVPGYQLRVTASDGENVPTEIFLHRRRPANPYSVAVVDDFWTVCTATHLAEWPAGEPREGYPLPCFRQATVDYPVRSLADAGEFWDLMKAEVVRLRSSLRRLAELVAQEEATCGDSDTSEDGSSDSSGGSNESSDSSGSDSSSES